MKNHIVKNKHYFYLFLILFISIFPRLWNLSDHPPVIVDEPANLRDLEKIKNIGQFNITDFHWDYSKSFLAYLLPFFLSSIFAHLDKLFILRISSAILSLIALVPLFLLIRKRTKDEIAFFLTILFSFSYYYLQFSRVGWINITFVLSIGLMMLFFLESAIEKKSKSFFALSGFLAALIFYSYKSAIVIIASAYILLFYKYLIKKRTKSGVYFVLIFTLTFLITASPWIAKTTRNWDQYNLRTRVVNIQNVQLPYHGKKSMTDVYKYQVQKSVSSWVFLQKSKGEGHENPRYLPSEYPAINTFVKITFWLGILVSFYKIRYFKKNLHWFFIFAMGLFLGQVMTVDPPNGARAIIFLPFYYIISANFLDFLYKKTNKKTLVIFLLLLITMIYAMHDLLFYQYWMTWINV